MDNHLPNVNKDEKTDCRNLSSLKKSMNYIYNPYDDLNMFKKNKNPLMNILDS